MKVIMKKKEVPLILIPCIIFKVIYNTVRILVIIEIINNIINHNKKYQII